MTTPATIAARPDANEAPPAHRPARTAPVVIALTLTLILWASAFAAIRVGLRAYSPYHLALLRFLVGSLTLGGYALFARMGLPALRDLPTLLLAAVFGIPIYHVALNYAEQEVSAGTAGLLLATSPVMSALLATAMLGERLNLRGWIGTAVSFAGAAMIVLAGEAGHGTSGAAGILKYQPRAVWVLLSALGGAVYTVAQKRGLARYTVLEFTAYAMWFGTAFLLFFFPGFPAAVRAAPATITAAGIYLGVFPAALAYLTWGYVLKRMTVGRAVSFLYLVPGLALLIAWFWLGEVPAISALLGGVFVVAGVALVNSRGRSGRPKD